jgi:hypothetical protein
MSAVRFAFAAVAWLFLACVVVQFFLAGLGVFAGAENFEVHRQFGYLFGWLTVIMIVLAAVGRLGRRWIGLSALLLVLFGMQSVFVVLRDSLPAVAALHPVNAVAIFFIAQHVARGSRALLRTDALAAQPQADPARL